MSEFLDQESNRKDAKNAYREYFRYSLTTRIAVIAPLIVIPILSFLLNDWWLLAGIIIVYIGGYFALLEPGIIYIFYLIAIIYWIKYGFKIHQYVTIFLLCYMFGHWSFAKAQVFKSKAEKWKEVINKKMEEYINNDIKPL